MIEEYVQIELLESFPTQIAGEKYELKEGQKAYTTTGHASRLVRHGKATYTNQKKSVEDPESEFITDDSEPTQEKKFDYEDYVENTNADDVISEVEESDTVTWLENLSNYDDRVTVQEAIDERLDELKE